MISYTSLSGCQIRCCQKHDSVMSRVRRSSGPIGVRMIHSKKFLLSPVRKSIKPARAVEDVDLEPTRLDTTVHVRVLVRLAIAFGDHLRLVGACDELGAWDVDLAPEFVWTNGDLWVADVELPCGMSTEFKLVHVTAPGERIWEYTCNRVMQVPEMELMKDGELTISWCDESEEARFVHPVQSSTLASWDDDDEPSSSGGFGSIFEMFSKDEVVGEAIDVVSDEQSDREDQAPVMEEIQEDNLCKDADVLAFPLEEIECDDETDESTNVDSDVVIAEREPEAMSNAKASSGDSLKKAAATAGMVAAGVAGAALLSTFAVDIADTAVLGAFAVAAGSAALGTKPKKATDSAQEDQDKESEENDVSIVEASEEKALSQDPGTIIAAGLAAAFDQATPKSKKEVENEVDNE